MRSRYSYQIFGGGGLFPAPSRPQPSGPSAGQKGTPVQRQPSGPSAGQKGTRSSRQPSGPSAGNKTTHAASPNNKPSNTAPSSTQLTQNPATHVIYHSFIGAIGNISAQNAAADNITINRLGNPTGAQNYKPVTYHVFSITPAVSDNRWFMGPEIDLTEKDGKHYFAANFVGGPSTNSSWQQRQKIFGLPVTQGHTYRREIFIDTAGGNAYYTVKDLNANTPPQTRVISHPDIRSLANIHHRVTAADEFWFQGKVGTGSDVTTHNQQIGSGKDPNSVTWRGTFLPATESTTN